MKWIFFCLFFTSLNCNEGINCVLNVKNLSGFERNSRKRLLENVLPLANQILRLIQK